MEMSGFSQLEMSGSRHRVDPPVELLDDDNEELAEKRTDSDGDCRPDEIVEHRGGRPRLVSASCDESPHAHARAIRRDHRAVLEILATAIEHEHDQFGHELGRRSVDAESDHGRRAVARPHEKGVEVRVQRHDDAIFFACEGEDRGIRRSGEPDIRGVHGLDPALAQTLHGAARETLIEQEPQADLGRSSNRSSSAAAA